jgi:streptogramin lyase
VLGTVTATIEIPGEATTVNPGSDSDTGGMVYGAGSLGTVDTHGLVRIDPATNAVIARVPGPSAYGGIVFVDGAVWYSSWDAGAVLRVDPTTNAIVATIPVPAGPEELAALPGSVWVASQYDWSASRIDTATNRVVATVRMPGEYPGCCGLQGIAAGRAASGSPFPASAARTSSFASTRSRMPSPPRSAAAPRTAAPCSRPPAPSG